VNFTTPIAQGLRHIVRAILRLRTRLGTGLGRRACRLALGLWLWPGLLHRAHLRSWPRLLIRRLPHLLSGLRLGTRRRLLARLDLRTLLDLAPLRLSVPQRLGT
jgi:hypothetical protein